MKKSLSVLAFLLTAFAVMAQKQASGVVSLSDTGEPEPGVTVVVTGTTSGTITDFDGNFQLTVPEGKTIEISYTGYKKVTLQPGSGMNVVLEPDDMVLEEVVAVGYGTMKKSDVTGSLSSVKADQLQRTPASGVDQALQGKAAGVTVNASSGQPGQGATIRIRGVGTVNSDASPIYVVDGVITSDIAFLSPNDIASMEVMKDASSTAIYGAQAANGVILITTKSGSSEKAANISFSTYVGIQNRWKKLDLMSAQEQAMMYSLMGGKAKLLDALLVQEDFNKWWKLKNNPSGANLFYPKNFDFASQETDWQDEVFHKNAVIQNYHLTISGGSDKGSYMLSADYFSQDGTIMGSNYDRLTIRLNSDFQARKWLKIGENLSYSTSQGRNAMNNSASAGASVISAALAMGQWDPTHYPEGSVNKNGEDISGNPSAGSLFTNVTNPFSMVYNSEPSSKTERWVGDLFVDITPVKGLSIRPSLSMDLKNTRDRNFKYGPYSYSTYDASATDYLSTSMGRYCTLINDNVINYSNTFNGKHFLSVMVGESMLQYSNYSLGSAGHGILNNTDPKNWYLSNTLNVPGDVNQSRSTSDGVGRNRLLSFFGRAHYTFDERYMITVNFRADASSKFKKSNHGVWGYFPSTALAWRINKESFLRDAENLDNLKLRLGWGQIGNERVGENSFTQTITSAGMYFVGYALGETVAGKQSAMPGSAVNTLANEDGKWETSEQWNVGLDFGAFNGMLYGSLDGYVKDTKDAILSVRAPGHVGNLYQPNKNVGIIRNLGLELTLGHDNTVGDFRYGISANLSLNKNELKSLNGGSVVYGDKTKCDEGLPVWSFWGLKYEGVYRTDEEAKAHLPHSTNEVHAGDAKYEDLNGDGNITDEDYQVLGNAFPVLSGSLSFNFEYFGFDFQVFFQGVWGNKIYNALRERTEGNGLTNQLSTDMRDVFIYYNEDTRLTMEDYGLDWQGYMEQYSGNIPNPCSTNPKNNETSSRFLEDGSYLRLKNITLGYTLPKAVTQKAKINRLRFYVTANNLLTLTKYSGYDPEVGSGVDYGNYPQARTVMFGLNLDF